MHKKKAGGGQIRIFAKCLLSTINMNLIKTSKNKKMQPLER